MVVVMVVMVGLVMWGRGGKVTTTVLRILSPS